MNLGVIRSSFLVTLAQFLPEALGGEDVNLASGYCDSGAPV